MEKWVVIGNGMTGYKFLEKLVEKGLHKEKDILVFGEEPRPAYDRVHLTDYYTGTKIEDLTLAPENWYIENNITLKTSELITEINRDEKRIKSHKGESYIYDKLILATGSSAFVPPIDGINKTGVFVYRTIEDLDAIKSYLPNAKKAAVIGGGLLGLEAAKAVLDDGLTTSIVEFADRLMPRQLDAAGSDLLKSTLEGFNLEVLLSKSTKLITGNGKVTGMDFTDDTSINVDMVVVSAGIKPRDELAKSNGLDVGPRGGILVNEQMQTNDKDIYAIGECALAKNMIWGLVAPCYAMAEVALDSLLGKEAAFNGFDMSTKLKLIGTDVASFGDAFGSTEGAIPIVFDNKAEGIYKRINISADKKHLLGGILVGEAEEYNLLLQMANNKMALPPNPEDLILGARGGEGGLQINVLDLPDDATVCSCENVTKGTLCEAVKQHDVSNIGELKMLTKAGTGCGGCLPMVDDLLTAIHKSQGKVVKKVICEHFNYTRQELLDLIKIDGLKTFNEVIAKHGKGCGCELCKPAVASILASTWNEPIPKQATIQDTNDRYLANIQRGGTYSVVPRIPGGEVTPEKLIAIGSIAKKYNLYTKITGGQRIDMFGAHVHELPEIWEELIEAGFESGHAYGKSLRTVKSCVGSTWCRYGQQDSVSFAIEVEERYKGLRSPHKLKGGVSGCIRECAEARGKDFGIIATDKGWNLYVCGNGGAKPTHAVLLASDIDSKTVFQYLDRFLMYYIKTAGPLTRTSKWLENLEGGIEHVKEVVVEDSLGIGAQLEEEMQFLIETYKCEWNEVVQNPELRKRFKHFVNAPVPNPEVKFKALREQKMPVEWEK